MRPTLLAAWIPCLGLVACEDELVGRAGVELVGPTEVPFGDVHLGVVAERRFLLEARGTRPASVRGIAVPAPFSLESAVPSQVAPQGSVELVVRFAPSALGPAARDLVVDSDSDVPVEVRLTGRGVEPPPCADDNPCTSDRFDPLRDECVHTFADGTPCQPKDRCVVGATCSLGVCLGTTKGCDDGSPCTRDVCRQADGECLHVPDLEACDDQNPCTADRCGPGGCEHEALISGTGCDDQNPCTTEDACFAGTCVGRGVGDGGDCDDGDSCTVGDRCAGGLCRGESIVAASQEGDVIFEHPLVVWPDAFLHRREVSLGEDDRFFGLDHLPLTDQDAGLTHVVFTMTQCGTPGHEFSYRPPDSHVLVSRVRREMQLGPDNTLRIVVGIRQLPENGFLPQTTNYVIDPAGRVIESKVHALGGETGRSLLPDGSHIYAIVWPLDSHPTPEVNAQNLVVVREDRDRAVLWRHERSSTIWSEFLGVAGPRVLFWAEGLFGALDFNTGSTVWTKPTNVIAKELAMSTGLNLGVARVGQTIADTQLLGVELIEGREVFRYPELEDLTYVPRTDPVFSADGRILVLMQKNVQEPTGEWRAVGLDWVELDATGRPTAVTPLPYDFPDGFRATRAEEDSYPTVADDGVAYVGYGSHFFAIDPGGQIRFTVTSTLANGFTGTVPLLRSDGVLLISDGDRRILGVKSNGGRMTAAGWASFRHDNRRTKFTP